MNETIKTILARGLVTAEVDYWRGLGWTLAGSPTVTPGGALLWVLVAPAA